jgi:hypothetical protein
LGDESPDGDRAFPPLSKLPRNGRRRIYPAEFEGAYAALPARHRPHPKAAAYQAWRSRVDDVAELVQLEAAADAYREDCEAREIVGTEFVMQASTFFGPGERWQPYIGVDPAPSRDELRPFGDGAARFV